jgi:hypothetical protein
VLTTETPDPRASVWKVQGLEAGTAGPKEKGRTAQGEAEGERCKTECSFLISRRAVDGGHSRVFGGDGSRQAVRVGHHQGATPFHYLGTLQRGVFFFFFFLFLCKAVSGV